MLYVSQSGFASLGGDGSVTHGGKQDDVSWSQKKMMCHGGELAYPHLPY